MLYQLSLRTRQKEGSWVKHLVLCCNEDVIVPNTTVTNLFYTTLRSPKMFVVKGSMTWVLNIVVDSKGEALLID